MPVFEVVSGGDRRSLMKRFERKSKQQAISELVDFHLLNCARIEKLERALQTVVNAADHGSWPTTVMHGIEVARTMLAAAPGKEVPQAWLDVQAERRRQITAEGWTPEHDDLYCAAELPRAAAAYILNGANDEAPAIWPFVAKWWKPRDARSNYVRAGALILAEIERLDRAAATQGGPSDA
ncbi:TPA: hypothetical protein ACJIUR_001201 [Pseudomonas aeruginosa]|uniref:hypothetical protein n=1 Tax=Pseudomonas aeruginosa TaxID=287 RepID=UPI00227E6799|nr:hypothetical protein [Pseudomonas aeruginosa]